MCFWNTAKITSRGMRETSDAASTRFHWSLKADCRPAAATVRTCLELLSVTISGQRELVQPNTKAKGGAVTMIGLGSGFKIRVRIFHSGQPSTRAVANTSDGSDLK